MHSLSRWKIRHGAVATAGALALSVAGYAAPAGATPTAPAAQLTGSVSPRPTAGTPELVPTTTSMQQIRQMVQCGNTMYAVGSFSSVEQGGTTVTRHNVFSFSASAPYSITSWDPNVNGEVNSITFNGSNCANAYIGGRFTSVHGTAAKDIAEISTSSGAVQPGFGTSTAGGEVDTLLGVDGHILVGGHFTWINGSHTDPYFASVSPITGKNDGFAHMSISGFYHYCDPSTGQCTSSSSSSVYNQQLSHNGQLDLVEGDFTSVGGKPRQQIFMLDLTGSTAKVTGWTSPEWDGSQGNLPGGYPYQCKPAEAFYMRSAAWSPDDQTVYIATTGFHPWNTPGGTSPRQGLCDAVSAFPATQTSVLHKWVEYSGCDSYYSVSADSASVYAAGHPRWADNSSGCNQAGPGAIPDRGLQGLNASDGLVETNSSGTGLYSMSRANADNMLITGAGLWISSSNRFGSQSCGTKPDHSGICFLPYS
jgi:hypothetical protein